MLQTKIKILFSLNDKTSQTATKTALAVCSLLITFQENKNIQPWLKKNSILIQTKSLTDLFSPFSIHLTRFSSYVLRPILLLFFLKKMNASFQKHVAYRSSASPPGWDFSYCRTPLELCLENPTVPALPPIRLQCPWLKNGFARVKWTVLKYLALCRITPHKHDALITTKQAIFTML